MDANEQPETLARAPWMKPDEVWLTVPGSGKQLVFNDESEFALSLTGTPIPVYVIGDRHGPDEILDWSMVSTNWGRATIADLARAGIHLHTALNVADFPFGMPDAATAAAWFELRAVLDDGDGFLVIERAQLLERLRDARRARTATNREHRAVERTAAAERRAAREAKAEREAEWRARPDYEALFEQFYGKAQAALDQTDSKEMIRYARRLVEHRLGLKREP